MTGSMISWKPMRLNDARHVSDLVIGEIDRRDKDDDSYRPFVFPPNGSVQVQ